MLGNLPNEILVLIFFSILGLGFVFLVLEKPWYGIISLLFTHIFITASTEDITIYEKVYIIIFFLTLGSWLLGSLFLKNFRKIIKEKVGILILLFLIVGFLSIFQAISNNVKFEDWMRDMWRFSPLLIFFLVVTEAKNKNQIKKLIILILMVGSIIAVKNIVYFIYLKDSQRIFWEFREAIYEHVSIIPFVSLLLSTVLLFFVKGRKWIIFLYAVILLCIFTHLAFGMRTEIITYILVIILSIFLKYLDSRNLMKSISFFRISPLLISVFVILSRIYLIKEFYGERFSRKALLAAYNVRAVEWNTVLNIIKQSPIFGKGFGYKYLADRIYQMRFVGYVHNFPLYLTLKIGIFGPILFYSILFLALKSSFNLFRKVHDQFQKGILAGISIYLTLRGFNSLIHTGFFRFEDNFLLAIFLGIIFSYERMERNN